MKNISILLFGLLLSLQLFSQQTFKGVVRDAGTGRVIEGVTVTVDGIRLGAISDATGIFTFQLPGKGPWVLRLRHIAYESVAWNVRKQNDSVAISEIIYLQPAPHQINPVVITSDRIEKNTEDVPARMNIINSTTIQSSPSTNIDEVLRSVPGMYVNRSWGMYSRNASVTMRGMGSASRVLVMLDGIPLNKSGGGGVNWNLLPNGAFEKIEIVKGPGSSMYGNNAMTGTINLITGSASDKESAEADFFISQFNTQGISFRLTTPAKVKKPYAWLSLSTMQGDGYYLDPEEVRNDYSSKCFLNQYNAYLKTGYLISDSARIELSALGSGFRSGLGTSVFEVNGNYDDFQTRMGSLRYHVVKKKSTWNAVAFVNHENYFNQSESINSYSEYKLSENPTKKIDAGIWTTVENRIKSGLEIVSGFDYKFSVEDGANLYLTATDEIYFFGMHNFAAVFTQVSKKIGKRSLLQAGLRYDFGQYSQGEILIENPTALSDFLVPYSGQHPKSTWHSLSPKVAYKINFSNKLNAYASVSKGFMPPTIDDMTRSGKIRKGIKVANPFLEPEVLYNVETGIQYQFAEKIKIEPTVFYSIADNMIYQVWTGDSVEILSDGPKPMIQKRNVSQGTVAGFELALTYDPLKWLSAQAAYSFNESKITKYKALEGDADLTGLYMAEVPKHLLSLDVRMKYRIYSLSTEYRYTGETFLDDENSGITDDYHVVNVTLGARIKNYNIGLSVNDLFDTQFIDKKGYLSPGRFVSARINVKL